MLTKKQMLTRIKNQDPEEAVISVTEFTWAVSEVLNLVSRLQKCVTVTNRGKAIVVIKPIQVNED